MPHEITGLSRNPWADCSSGPGRRCVLSEEIGSQLVFSELDPQGRRGRELARADSVLHLYHSWCLSPSGKQVLLARSEYRGASWRRTFTLIDLETGLEKPFRFSGGLAPDWVGWSQDGDGFVGTAEVEGEEAIFRVGSRGQPVILYRTKDLIYNALVSPDGRHLAFTKVTHGSATWVLEGF
jgi:hypothetical protein